MPPYFVVLPIAWAAANYSRGVEFSWKYLFFLQNYSEPIPFFLASWSLCIEEHFYAVAMLLLGALSKNRSGMATILVLLCILSPCLRLIDPNAVPLSPFGYAETATHLRLTGIATGLVGARLAVFHHSVWLRVQRHASQIAIPAILGGLSIRFWSQELQYYLASDCVSVTALLCLAAVQGRRSYFGPDGVVYWIANTSYSCYLTHALTFHAVRMVRSRLNLSPLQSLVACALLLFLVTAIFWFCVERSAVKARDYLVPR